MSLLRRIILLNAAVILVVTAVLVVGVGIVEGQRHAESAMRESKVTADLVVAAMAAGDLDGSTKDLSRLLEDVSARLARSVGGASSADPLDISVTDVNGRVLASTGDHEPGALLVGAEGPIADGVLRAEQVVFRVEAETGARTYCAVPVEYRGSTLAVIVEHPAGAEAGSLWRVLAGFGIAGLTGGALLLALEAGLLSRWIVAPLSHLRVAMESLGWGSFSTRLSADQGQEMVEVAEAFNAMAGRLDEMSDRRLELELLAESLGPGLILSDPDGVVKWASQRAAHLLNIPVREMKGARLTTLVSDPSVIRAAIREDGSGLTPWADELVFEAPGEERRWLSLRGFPLVNEDGRRLDHAVVVMDESGSREWRGEQRRLVAALSDSNRVRGGLFQLIRGEFGARLAGLAHHDWEAREMLALVDELGDMDVGYLRAVVADCVVADLVDAALESRAVLAASRGINLQVRADRFDVLGDTEGLVRCIGHVLSAAFYLTRHSVLVETGIDLTSPQGRRVRLDVEVRDPALTPEEMRELVSGPLDAAVLGVGPGVFGLALYLAARQSVVLRSELELREGEEGSLIIGVLMPLNPLAPEAQAGAPARLSQWGGSLADPLTGLASRIVFERTLSEEVHRASRTARSLALLALEVDDFEELGRVHGRDTGDRLIKELADLARRSLRKDDLAGRVRETTVMILLPDTTEGVASALAEKLSWTINRHIFATPSNRPIGRFTVSIGIAIFPVNGAFARELMLQAEAALAEAKKEGGNQVKAAGSHLV